jgi:cation diffusion facilitator CzcD-associated flavoprotein CzcO
MPAAQETKPTVAVIGAGPSGLAAMRNLKAAGINFVGYESHASIGGIWDRDNPKSSVYRNTHTITSKGVTAFSDYAMPDDFPVYPSHHQVLSYLNSYADHHALIPHIQFNEGVESIKRALNGGWMVWSSSGRQTWYKEVIIANGHNWHPRKPDFAGEFTGRQLHACEYTDAREFADKRVLVIGAGNSGCDIAVECCQVSTHVALSMRRGYHFYPKFIAGYPADYLGMKVRSLGIPSKWASKVMGWLLRLSAGDQQRMGLPKPDHRPLQTPAIVNSLVPYYVAHGRIAITPGIERFENRLVHFTDGTVREFDVVIFATGSVVSQRFSEERELLRLNF